MDNEELDRIWMQYLDAAEKGTKKGRTRKYRSELCKIALECSDKLTGTGYITPEKFDLWEKYLAQICTVLEGDDEMIQRTVREYFLSLHCGEFEDFWIKFIDKTEGTSNGDVCIVRFSGREHRFYIKCHQRGQISTSLMTGNRYNSIKAPFIQEIFIYKLLSMIKVGGEVHFPIPIKCSIKKVLYIATEEIQFTVAKQLNIHNVNVNAMILVHFLEYVFRLEDIGANGGNYGQSFDGKPVIVDFWVFHQDSYALSDAQIHDFKNGVYNSNSGLISYLLKKVTNVESKRIISEAVEEWELLNKIDEAQKFSEKFILKNKRKLEISGDLNRYVRDIKFNVEKILQ